jgi:hypothetical protein
LLEVVVDYLFEDSSWEKTLSDLILGWDSISLFSLVTSAHVMLFVWSC